MVFSDKADCCPKVWDGLRDTVSTLTLAVVCAVRQQDGEDFLHQYVQQS